jgi:succinoglycan biosynthesis protein ExoO
MAADPRIRVIANPINRGPAYCRNRALDIARGEWVAVVDSDDIIHPERFDRLLAVADQQDGDIIADDLLLFHEDGSPPRLMLGDETRGSFTVLTRDWVVAGVDGSPSLGYLKPMIRADLAKQLRYDEGLRIGEDYDFVLRLLLLGARMVVVSEPFYLYRRHSASISHRLSVDDMRAMVERQTALTDTHQPFSTELAAAFARRLSALKSGLAYEELVASIRGRRLTQALRLLAAEPAHLGRLWTSFVEGRQRRSKLEAGLHRPEPLILGGQGTAGVNQVVPDYVPANLVDWSAPRRHSVWQALAVHAKRRCVALDKAGQYASGFIPEVMLEEGEDTRGAS